MTTMTTTDQTCGPACWRATEPDCRCSCGGTKHGAANTGSEGSPLRRECVIDGQRYVLGTVTFAGNAFARWAHQEARNKAVAHSTQVLGYHLRQPPAFNDKGAIVWRRLASLAQAQTWPEVLEVTAELRAFREQHSHGRPVKVPRPYLIWVREDCAPSFDAWLESQRHSQPAA